MQICKRCKHLCEDKFVVCPECKHPKTLKTVKDNDEVFFMKGHDFEVETYDVILSESGIKHSVLRTGNVYTHNPFDSQNLPEDQSLYVAYSDIEAAKSIIDNYETEHFSETEEDTMPRWKRLLLDAVGIILFMILVAIVVACTDKIANGLRSFLLGV